MSYWHYGTDIPCIWEGGGAKGGMKGSWGFKREREVFRHARGERGALKGGGGISMGA